MCKICNSSEGNRVFTIKEMMFGLNESFEYFLCENCGCLQIISIPHNLNRYYPKEYYSLSDVKRSPLKSYLKRQRGRYSLGLSNMGGKLLKAIWGVPDIVSWIKVLNLSLDSKILDIGSGSGIHLKEFNNLGFENLTGVDPFLETDIEYSDTFRIYKNELSEISGSFDFIMMNHVLEHIPNQFSVLDEVFRLIDHDGTVMIRIPITGTHAWNTYQTNWVQLDAPRHLYLHSINSFKILCEKVGFEITDIVFDSTEFQFVGSEGYKNNIPLVSQNQEDNFSSTQLENFKRKARLLNESNDGDQARFYLKKISPERIQIEI